MSVYVWVCICGGGVSISFDLFLPTRRPLCVCVWFACIVIYERDLIPFNFPSSVPSFYSKPAMSSRFKFVIYYGSEFLWDQIIHCSRQSVGIIYKSFIVYHHTTLKIHVQYYTYYIFYMTYYVFIFYFLPCTPNFLPISAVLQCTQTIYHSYFT